MIKRHWKFITVSLTAIVAGVFLFFLIFSNLVILQNKRNMMFVEDAPTSSLALVFGGGLNNDGSPNDMAMDRVIEGVALYKSGKVAKIMITGDDGQRYGNEVDVMKKAAVDFGVPEEKILLDRHGYRTYESCFREARVYGVTDVIAVSQAFHLPRIIYLCENFGIKTYGVAADLRDYGADSFKMEVREIAARLKAWWQVRISHPLPTTMEK